MDEPIITRATLGALGPLTHPRHLPPPTRLWGDAEWERIRRGFRASSRHDHWNAYVEQGRLHFHRRGSGVAIYEAQFTPIGDAWVITELLMCGDPEVHRADTDQVHSTHVVALIDSLLLGADDTAAIRALRIVPPEPVPA